MAGKLFDEMSYSDWLFMMLPTMKRDDPLRPKMGNQDGISTDKNPVRALNITIEYINDVWVVMGGVHENGIHTGGTFAKPHATFDDAVETAKRMLDNAKEDKLGG